MQKRNKASPDNKSFLFEDAPEFIDASLQDALTMKKLQLKYNSKWF